MRELLHRLRRLIAAIFNFGVSERERQVTSRQAVESMKARLAELRAGAVRVIAGECRIERMLAAERERLANLEEQSAMTANACGVRVAELESELEAARRHSAEAKQRIEEFQEELMQASDRARDAQVRLEVARVRAQAERFAMTASLDKELMAVRLMEQRADAASAEAEALAELNQALGHGGGGDYGNR